MNAESFAKQIRKSIIEDNLAIYRDLFASTSPDGASDPYWKRSLALYGNLTEEEKAVLFEIIRQVMSDTVSNFMGVLDGVSTLEGADDELVLSTREGGEEISGNLQDLFLELEEES